MPFPLEYKKVLIAPLNWGLGHATRCMPLIDTFLAHGTEVHLGGDGASFRLLKEAYPHLNAHELPSYNIEYPAGAGAWRTLFKAPSIIRAIREERQVVAALAEKLQLDLIISDNRYGAHAAAAYSVFICHQLNVLPPKGFRWGAPFIFRWHKSFFGRFDHIWIPDFAGEDNLSGELSHGLNTGLPTDFIGPQSRFAGLDLTNIGTEDLVVMVLSGPEPQRTLLETLLTEQALQLQQKVVMVRGVVEAGPDLQEHHLIKVNYLHKEALCQLLKRASCVVCRPGYSTLMDLSQLGKKVILIPTPGQTEQEYLAENLSRRNAGILQKQSQINLQHGLDALAKIEAIPQLNLSHHLLEQAMDHVAKAIQSRQALRQR